MNVEGVHCAGAHRLLFVFVFFALVFLLGASSPRAALASDFDADGVEDADDNCEEHANGVARPDRGGLVQYDADGDGFGNRCDADYDQDGVVGGADFLVLRGCTQAQVAGSPHAAGCAVADHDGSGEIDELDHRVFRRQLSARRPGPSGLPCADATSREVCPASRNVLLIVGDDIGVDVIGTYAERIPGQAPPAPDGRSPPPTPHLDQLARDGILFTRVWSNPLCGATRATLMTGRYAGRMAPVVDHKGRVPSSELTLPRVLDHNDLGYAHAAFGKWGVNESALGRWSLVGPELAGFGHFSGFIGSALSSRDYYRWQKTTNRPFSESWSTTYATSDHVDAAIEWISARDPLEPWFVWLTPFSAHVPHHDPDRQRKLSSFDLAGTDCDAGVEAQRACYRAAIEALDTEIGRLLRALDRATRARTTIIFTSDNGTEPGMSLPPFDRSGAKSTLGEVGLRVPLIVSGAGVAAGNRVSHALVNTTDVFDTVRDLTGAKALPLASPARDSISLAPILRDPCPDGRCVEGRREFVYSERRSGAGRQHPTLPLFACAPDLPHDGRAIRNASGYKLVRYRTDFGPDCPPAPVREEFYFLGRDRANVFDVDHADNRITPGPGLDWEADAAYRELSALLPSDETAAPAHP